MMVIIYTINIKRKLKSANNKLYKKRQKRYKNAHFKESTKFKGLSS